MQDVSGLCEGSFYLRVVCQLIGVPDEERRTESALYQHTCLKTRGWKGGLAGVF